MECMWGGWSQGGDGGHTQSTGSVWFWSELWKVGSKASILQNSTWACIGKMKPQLLVCFRKDAQSQLWVVITLTSYRSELGSLFNFQMTWLQSVFILEALRSMFPYLQTLFLQRMNLPSTVYWGPREVTKNIQNSAFRETVRPRLSPSYACSVFFQTQLDFKGNWSHMEPMRSQTLNPSNGLSPSI